MKGLLPDEEKEKIGPKPASGVISAPPMKPMSNVTVSAGPKPHHQLQPPPPQMQKMVFFNSCYDYLHYLQFLFVFIYF